MKDNFEEWDNIENRWKILLLGRRVEGMKELVSELAVDSNFPGFSKEEELKDCNLRGSRIGRELNWYHTSDLGYDEPVDWVSGQLQARRLSLIEIDSIPLQVAQEDWPHFYLSGITWITEPKYEEAAYSQVTYGNEALVVSRYSCAAIIASIPPWYERTGTSD